MYSGEELSEPLELVVAPEVLANTQTYYVFEVSETTIGKWSVHFYNGIQHAYDKDTTNK